MIGTDKGTIRAPGRDVTRDPREDEDWFQRLPPDVQEETREVWRRRLVRHDPWYGRQGSMRKRCIVEGLVVLMVPSVLMGFAGWAPFGTAAVAGPLLGWIWWRAQTGAFSAFAVSMAGFLGAAFGLRRELDRREQAL